MLLYDHQTDSLWSQILAQAVTGPLTGTRLSIFPLVETTWSDWKKQHPGTLVLSLNTGYRRRYQSDPYGIAAGRGLGVMVGGKTKVFPFRQLEKVKSYPLRDRLGGRTILIYFVRETQRAWATDPEGGAVDAFPVYLQAWQGFYPESEVFEAR